MVFGNSSGPIPGISLGFPGVCRTPTVDPCLMGSRNLCDGRPLSDRHARPAPITPCPPILGA